MERKADSLCDFELSNEMVDPQLASVDQPLRPKLELSSYSRDIVRLAFVGEELERFSKKSHILLGEIRTYCELMRLIDRAEAKHQ